MSDGTPEPTEVHQESKIITVTLNPSLDRTFVTHFLAVGYHNRTVETTKLHVAGRGMNVARAVHALGMPVHAVALIGVDATGRSYEALLTKEQFPITVLRRSGRTRSNIVIKDTGLNNETVILEESEGVTQEDLRIVSDTLIQLINPNDVVVFAGSLPGSVPTDTYTGLIDTAQKAGAKVAVNAGGGAALEESLSAGPDLIYLTRTELEGMFNFPVRAYEDVVYCAQQLRERGAQRVLVSMPREMDALLVTEEGMWMADQPEVEFGTHSGQTEALVAGYLAVRRKGGNAEEAIRLAAAAAAFAVSHLGAEFGTMHDIEPYLTETLVTPIRTLEDLPQPDPENPPPSHPVSDID